MMTADVKVGRLLEVVLRSPMTQDELTPLMSQIRGWVERSVQPLVIVTDVRGVSIIPPDMADPVVWMLRRDNPKIQCNAVLIQPGNLALARQVEQMAKEGKHPGRRMFSDVGALRAYIDPLLDAQERARVTAFLG